MGTDNLTDLFDDYLTGKMPEAVLFEFEKRLREDSALNAEFQLHKSIVAAVSDFRKSQLKSFIAQNTQVLSVPFYRRTGFYYAAIAAMFLLVGTFVLVNYNPTQIPIANNQNEDVGLAQNDQTTEQEKPEVPKAVELPPKIADSKRDAPTIADNQPTTADEISASEDVSDGMALDKVGNNENEPPTEKISKGVGKSKAEDTIEVETDLLILDTIFQIKTPAESNPISIKVEFWQSPINFKGYQWPGGKTLKIYGNFDPGKLTILKTESDDYYVVTHSKEVYSIVPCTDYKRFQKITNPTILKSLELK